MRERSPSDEGTEITVGELMTLLRWPCWPWPKPTLMRFRPDRRDVRLLLHMGGGESWLLAVETLEGVRERPLASVRAPGKVLGVYTPLLALRGCSPSRTLNGSRLWEGKEPARSVLRLGAAEDPKLITSTSSSGADGR